MRGRRRRLDSCVGDRVQHRFSTVARQGLAEAGQGRRVSRPAAPPTSPDPEHTRQVTLLAGSALPVFALPTRKRPAEHRSVQRAAHERGRSDQPASACGWQYRDPTMKSGSGALAVGDPVSIVLRLKDNAVVEFGERQFDVDLWKGQNGVGD